MAYTLEDFIKLNPNYKKSYDAATKTASLINSSTGKSINFGVGQGQQYGIGALQQNNSQSIDDVSKLLAALGPSKVQPAAYESPYSSQITNTLAAISSRPSFSYDPASDVGLQAAQTNAMDAVSRAAARRGMLYSDSNKSQMGKAALQLVPQFEAVAYDKYNQRGQDLYSQLSALSNLENQNYADYRNSVEDARYAEDTEYDRNFAMQQFLADQEQQNFENDLALTKAIKSGSSGSGSGSAKEEKPRLTFTQMQDAISSGNITPSVINAYEYYYEVPYVPSSEPAPSTPSVSTYNKPVTSGSKDLTTEGARKEKLSSQTKKAKKTSPTQAILDQAAVIENLYNSGRLTEEQANSMLDAIGIPR